MNASLNDSMNTYGEAGKPVTHYWDLISKYFSYYSSVSYINSQLEEVEPQNKALTWLILALNENGLLYYCFQLIFTNGSFLSHYSEDQSYMHLHREQLLGISQNIYAHKLFVANVQHQRYQEYLDKALRERIKSNSEFHSGAQSDRSLMGPDGFKHSRSIGGSDYGGDGDSVELKRMADEDGLVTKDKEQKLKRKRNKKEAEPAIKIVLEVPVFTRAQSVMPRPSKRLSYNKTGCGQDESCSEAKALQRVRPSLLTHEVKPKEPSNEGSSSEYTSVEEEEEEESNQSEKEEQFEQTKYQARLAAGGLRLNLFSSKGDENFQSIRSGADGAEYDSFHDDRNSDSYFKSRKKDKMRPGIFASGQEIMEDVGEHNLSVDVDSQREKNINSHLSGTSS